MNKVAKISQRSPLANTISTKPMVTRKKGHWSYIQERMIMLLGSASSALCKATPSPSQTRRWNRVCVQAKIHGMARRDSMPPLGLHFDGRLPVFMRPYSSFGVACWRNIIHMKPPFHHPTKDEVEKRTATER